MKDQHLMCFLYNEIVFSGKSELYQKRLHGKSAYTHFTGIRACQLFCYEITVLSKEHLLNEVSRSGIINDSPLDFNIIF